MIRIASVRAERASVFASEDDFAHDLGHQVRFELVMIFPVHGAIVADDVIEIGAEMDGGHFPIAEASDIRFRERMAVNVEDALVKRNRLAGQADDAFHIQLIAAGFEDADDIATFRFGTDIGKAVDEVNAAIGVVRGHADAGNADGNDDELEKYKGGEDDDADANKGPFGPSPKDQSMQPARERTGFCFAIHSFQSGSGKD